MKTVLAAIVVGTILVLALGVAGCGGEADKTLKLAEGVEMKLVRIPAGKFLMGSPETEKGRDNDETQHEVTLTKPFYMGQTHVTVDQFAAFVKDSGYKTDAEKDGWTFVFEIRDGKGVIAKADGASWRKPGFEQTGNHPVVHISWQDAVAFCDWLSKKSGKPVRLPTEAEWEYACRAGTTTAYPWGDKAGDGKSWANAGDQSLRRAVHNMTLPEEAFFGWDDGFVFTSPGGSFRANAFGLYDMIGNALQWCADWYGDYEKGAAVDPTGPATGSRRVLRGGSWSNNPSSCRSANRIRNTPDDRDVNFGFRVVVSGVAGVD